MIRHLVGLFGRDGKGLLGIKGAESNKRIDCVLNKNMINLSEISLRQRSSKIAFQSTKESQKTRLRPHKEKDMSSKQKDGRM